jgi:hypothetical protein
MGKKNKDNYEQTAVFSPAAGKKGVDALKAYYKSKVTQKHTL